MQPLNLFYQEPDPDRWVPGDRYPRRLVRRVLRGRSQPGGVMRWFLNLEAGLRRLGVPLRVNDFRRARRHPGGLACVVGKPHVLDRLPAGTPVLFGPGVYSHPCDDPGLLDRRPALRVVLSCEWLRAMYAAGGYDPGRLAVWAAGIDTDLWRPGDGPPAYDVLLYDKVRWDRGRLEPGLIQPVRAALAAAGVTVAEVRYGAYREEEYRALVRRCRALVFLCEHETQGFAYLQALACGVPILAWDRGGEWRDPSYHPHRVRYGPVTSVPYWDDSCGLRFRDAAEFARLWPDFWEGVRHGRFAPRDYVLRHLGLEDCARRYLALVAGARTDCP